LVNEPDLGTAKREDFHKLMSIINPEIICLPDETDKAVANVPRPRRR
jgi:hypothetical protein